MALSAGNSPVTGEFPSKRPVRRSFDVFFDLCPNKRLSKQSWGWWFETPARSLWRHCNVKATHSQVEWVIDFNDLLGHSGHQGPCSPYKPCNHSLYIGIIIFLHMDNTICRPQLTLRNNISKKKHKRWGYPLSWTVIGDGNSTSVYNNSKYITTSLDWYRSTDCDNKPTRRK